MAKLRNYIGYGLLADRPPAGAPGALYWTSDTHAGYRDNGASWDTIVAPGLPLLAVQALSVDAPALAFSAIVAGYAALQVDVEARGVAASTSLNLRLRFNGDDGAHYDTQVMDGFGSTAEAGEHFTGTQVLVVQIPAADAPSGVFGGARIYLPAYDQAREKRVQAQGGGKFSASADGMEIWLSQGYWRSSDAITALELTADTGDLAAGSTARLYGVP